MQKGNRVNSNSSRPGDALGSQDASSQAHRMAGAAQGWQSTAAPAAEGEGGLAQPFGGGGSHLFCQSATAKGYHLSFPMTRSDRP